MTAKSTLIVIQFCFSTGNNATFVKHKKVSTGNYVYSIDSNLQYAFMCNSYEKPYHLSVKIDDNSRFFADRCSFDVRRLTKKRALAKLKNAPKGNRWHASC